MEGTIINDTPISGNVEFYVGTDSSTAGTPNLLFEQALPERGTDGIINIDINETKIDYLLDADYFRVYITVNSVFNAQMKSTDNIIIKDIYLSGEGKIDIEDLRRRSGDEE